MGLLKNQKHERFAQIIATGKSASSAYGKVYGKRGRVAEAAASRLLRNVNVTARVAELQERAASSAVMSIQEKREFLALAKRTPVGKVDENSPLAQAVEYELITRGSKKGRTVMKLKVVDKLKAIELDAKLAGEFKEKVEVSVDGLGELLKMIRGGK